MSFMNRNDLDVKAFAQQRFLSEIYDELVDEEKFETKNWTLVLTVGGMKFINKNKNSKGQQQQVSLTVDEK